MSQAATTMESGLRHRGALGATDDLCQRIVERPVSIPDFHATLYAALGIDPSKILYDGPRPVPITDGGHAVRELFYNGRSSSNPRM